MKIDDVIDLAAHFDPIDRIEGVWFVFRNAHWRKAYRKHGVIGIVGEFIACVFARNVVEHEFERGEMSGADIEAMLSRHGVKIGDRGFGRDNQHLSFVTKKSQARWAEYLMRRYGAPLTSTVDPRNVNWARSASARLGREPKSRQSMFGSVARVVISTLAPIVLAVIVVFVMMAVWK